MYWFEKVSSLSSHWYKIPGRLCKSRKFQLFEEYRENPDNTYVDARIFTILIRRSDLKIVSDGKK